MLGKKNYSILAVLSADCLSLAVCWPCFQTRWTHRLKTALFMVDASAPSSMKEETGLATFISHVRQSLCTADDRSTKMTSWFLTSCLLCSLSPQIILRKSLGSCWMGFSRQQVPGVWFWLRRMSSTSACPRQWCSDTTGSSRSHRASSQALQAAKGCFLFVCFISYNDMD